MPGPVDFRTLFPNDYPPAGASPKAKTGAPSTPLSGRAGSARPPSAPRTAPTDRIRSLVAAAKRMFTAAPPEAARLEKDPPLPAAPVAGMTGSAGADVVDVVDQASSAAPQSELPFPEQAAQFIRGHSGASIAADIFFHDLAALAAPLRKLDGMGAANGGIGPSASSALQLQQIRLGKHIEWAFKSDRVDPKQMLNPAWQTALSDVLKSLRLYHLMQAQQESETQTTRVAADSTKVLEPHAQ
jgi:hypothetical protein